MGAKVKCGGAKRSTQWVCLFLALVGNAGCSDNGFVEAHEPVLQSQEALPSVSELFPVGQVYAGGPSGSLDGRLVSFPCLEENPLGTDCATGGAWYKRVRKSCSGGALNVVHTFPVGGTPGTAYVATFRFYGIVEPKNYGSNVTRDAGVRRPGNQDTGAIPTPFASAPANHIYQVSDYNTYELRVKNNQGNEVAAYYLNADTREGHWTYVLNFQKQITVIGGGSVVVRNYDKNCREVKNCGLEGTPTSQCAQKATSRIINVSGANPVPPNIWAPYGGLRQPTLVVERSASASGQWLLIDVVSVDAPL